MAKKKFYRPILVWIFLIVRGFFMLFPLRFGFSFGGTIGKLCYHLLAKERNKMIRHLRMAFGDTKTDAEFHRIAKANFEHYGQTLAELALVDKIVPRINEYVRTTGFDHFTDTYRSRGAIVIVAHFGNWELMGAYGALNGHPMTVIAREIYYDKYNALLVGLRKKLGVKTIYRDNSPKEMLRAFKASKILVIVGDQDVEDLDGVLVDFFGRPAYTPVAPVRFAQVTGAALIPAFMIREGMKHHMIVEPPIVFKDTGNKDEDVRRHTQEWVAIQEKYIRQYPHLWVWNHKRWKTAEKMTAALEKPTANRI